MRSSRTTNIFKSFQARLTRVFQLSVVTLGFALLLGGCQSRPPEKAVNQAQVTAAVSEPVPKPTPTPVPAESKPVATSLASAATAKPLPTAVPPGPFKAVRIKAGGTDSFTDSAGNVWLPDRGFEGGETIARPELEIANTKDPQIYRAERYLMDSFSWPVPNGNYVLKLHFAETFEGITGPGLRVFSFDAQGNKFNDFDVWQKAGGPLRAYVETIPVTATNGVIKIVFTAKVENPQINGIEILPAP